MVRKEVRFGLWTRLISLRIWSSENFCEDGSAPSDSIKYVAVHDYPRKGWPTWS